ncbi:hypothetical protein [Gordonia aichiensis]|uniref:antitoxin VbhA family protein n=1 Tax=Gordonia aichiensis TaxID=36820 RepID=UPI003267AEA4
MTELDKVRRRSRTIRSIRRNTEIEGTQSTPATRKDQLDYVRGTISAAELSARVRARYGVE